MDVATSPVHQIVNKEDTTTDSKNRTNNITMGLYLGKYMSHTNMHTQIEYKGAAQIQKVFKQDHLQYQNAQETADIEYMFTAQPDNRIAYIHNANVGVDPGENRSQTQRRLDIVHLL